MSNARMFTQLESFRAASRLALDIDAIGGGAMAKLAGGLKTGMFPKAIRVVEMPHLQRLLSTIDTAVSVRTIADVSRSLNLGLPSGFGQDIQLAVGELSEHMQSLSKIGLTSQPVFDGLGLSNLENSLVKSLTVYEALLEETTGSQRWTIRSEEQRLNRRHAVFLAVISIIMFLLSMVSAIDDWMTNRRRGDRIRHCRNCRYARGF